MQAISLTLRLLSLNDFVVVHATSSIFSPDFLNNACLTTDTLGSDVQLHWRHHKSLSLSRSSNFHGLSYARQEQTIPRFRGKYYWWNFTFSLCIVIILSSDRPFIFGTKTNNSNNPRKQITTSENKRARFQIQPYYLSLFCCCKNRVNMLST